MSSWLDGHSPAPGVLAQRADLRAQIELQDSLAKILAAGRRRDGALDVETAQPRAVVDAHGQVTGLAAHHQDRAGGIVEELMIASNRAVARALDARGVSSIRRVVKEPERWAKIVVYAAGFGATLSAAPSSLELSRFVDRMRAERPDDFGEISLALINLMGRGEYVAHRPGTLEIGHFGLATEQYTHATAPNRRYVDLVTQRLVLRSHAYSEAALGDLAAHCSEREKAAEKVERRVLKSVAAQLLAPMVGQTFEGVVTGASDKGVFVRIFHPTAEGKIVAGERALEVGSKVRVRLSDVRVDRGFIDFTVA